MLKEVIVFSTQRFFSNVDMFLKHFLDPTSKLIHKLSSCLKEHAKEYKIGAGIVFSVFVLNIYRDCQSKYQKTERQISELVTLAMKIEQLRFNIFQNICNNEEIQSILSRDDQLIQLHEELQDNKSKLNKLIKTPQFDKGFQETESEKIIKAALTRKEMPANEASQQAISSLETDQSSPQLLTGQVETEQTICSQEITRDTSALIALASLHQECGII